MKIYCLNLPRSEKRRSFVKTQAEKFGLEFYWVAGGDREEMRILPENYDPSKAQRDIMRQMGIGEIGCLMGHLRAFQAIIDSGEEWGIVLEDDVELHKHPVEQFQEAATIAGKEGKLILGSSVTIRREIRRSYKGDIHELSAAPYGAFCYAIHRKFAAQAIVHLAHSLHMPMDVYFRHACRLNPHGFWQAFGIASESKLGEVTVIGDEARCSKVPEEHRRQTEIQDVCPPLIHQIWFGPKTIPRGVKSWQEMNPSSIYRLWTAKDVWPILRDYGFQDIWTSYMSQENYVGAADVARYCILHRFGGFYADADSEALRPMDIQSEFFVYESERYRPGTIVNGFLNIKARHPVIMDAIERVRQIEHPVPLERCWVDLGPRLITEIVNKYPGISVLPSGLFIPEHFEGPNDSAGVAPYCKHFYNSTWKPNQDTKQVNTTPAKPKWLRTY